jgi:H+/Cl- antiporter ClcA
VASAHRAAPGFWLAVVVTGAGTGLGAAALMHLLYVVQHTLWPGAGMDLLDAAAQAGWPRHLAVLLGAGLLTSVGHVLLGRLPGTSIDVTSAIWLHAGRLPALRSLGSAVLSVVVVGMGASLGREGAPKQAGAVIANAASDRGAFPTTSGGSSSPAAPARASPRPMACRWAARSSRSKCCAADWHYASCCPPCSPRSSRPA